MRKSCSQTNLNKRHGCIFDFNFIKNLIKNRNKYLVVIAGPTAVGKTGLGIELAEHYKTEILSADSRQFYEELNIGTAKPAEEQLKLIKHHFIGTKKITELYGAGHFEKDAVRLLEELFQAQDLVLLVGGSGLYIDAVLNGVDDFIDIPASVRESVNASVEELGLPWLQGEIKKRDPHYFESTDIQNTQRLKRALEVCLFTEKPYSSFLGKGRAQRNFTSIKILVDLDREILYDQINSRVDQMMRQGLLEEAKKYSAYRHYNALKTVGYRELYEYMDGKTDLAAAIDKIKQHTRNYAKRQLTWFHNRDSFMKFDVRETGKIISYIDSIIRHE